MKTCTKTAGTSLRDISEINGEDVNDHINEAGELVYRLVTDNQVLW